jgi:hypothetical protein
VKVRSHDALIAYNLIENAGNYEIDLIQNPPQTDAPNANAILIGNVIIRRPARTTTARSSSGARTTPATRAATAASTRSPTPSSSPTPSNRLFHAINPAAGSQIHLVNSIVHATVSGTGLAADATTAGILVGSNDWISSDVTAAGSLSSVLTGTSPGFVSATDLHLTAASPVLDAGLNGVTAVDGTGASVNGLPDQEYSALLGTVARATGSTWTSAPSAFRGQGTGGRRTRASRTEGHRRTLAHRPTPARTGGLHRPTVDRPGRGDRELRERPGGACPMLALARGVLLLARRRSVNSRS